MSTTARSMKFHVFLKNTYAPHTQVGSGSPTSLAGSPLPAVQSSTPSPAPAQLHTAWLVMLSFPTPRKGGKSPSIPSHKLCCIFGNLLLDNRDPNTFTFSFQTSCLLFIFHQFSHFILSPKYSHLVFQLFLEFVSAPCHRRGAWQGAGAPPSQYWAARTNQSAVITSIGADQEQQVTGWWKYTYRGNFNLQTLPSSFAPWSPQEANTGDFSQEGILHMPL